VENGYRVVGHRVLEKSHTKTDFSGVLLDAQIKEVVTNEFSMSKTLLGVALTAGILAAVIGVGVAIGCHQNGFM
jgi:hypothetical protein